jgi:hypothetical protein
MKKISNRCAPASTSVSLSWLTLLFLLFSGCSPMKITWDYDKNADFKKYKSYNFAQSVNHSRLKSVSKELIVSAVTREMDARGYRKSNSLAIDIWIDLFIAFDKTVMTTETNDQIVGMRPYRYGGGFSNSFKEQHTYVEGTLVVDMIDGKTNEIVWEGRAITSIKDEQPEASKEKLINEIIAKIFTKYPVSSPVTK